ncbi:MAG: 1-acyl-sn-glycerol-3-phosphate acyltransferase [Chthoniobacterales bacterium]|nr:1-acyl-sn-glycerol-3-phosphate acyltransferase [Chthoniobacterales bacterium]
MFPLIARRRLVGMDRLGGQRGPFLLASNHISHFDPPVITSLVPFKIDWMAVVELFQHPVAAAYFRSVDAFPTDRSKADLGAVRVALERLKQGHVVGIYPEGGIRDGARSVLGGAPLKPGAATLAQMAGVPIVPCVVIGSDRLYNAKNWRRFRATPLWVAVGVPLEIDTGLPKSEARKDLEKRLGSAILALAAELREGHGVSEEDMPASPQSRMREP